MVRNAISATSGTIMPLYANLVVTSSKAKAEGKVRGKLRRQLKIPNPQAQRISGSDSQRDMLKTYQICCSIWEDTTIPPLISKETLIELGMLKIQPDGSLAEPNNLAISKGRHSGNIVNQMYGEKGMKDLITKYSHLFQGIGKIEDKKNHKEILSGFHVKPKVVTVAQKPRQVPCYLQGPLKKWLDLGIDVRYL